MLGICNGFQVLCEAGLLPGALLPNTNLRFAMRQTEIEVVDADTRLDARHASRATRLSIPAKHTTGPLLRRRPADVRVVFRYAADPIPNGSEDDIAGVANAAGNVVGLMPHPGARRRRAARLCRRPEAVHERRGMTTVAARTASSASPTTSTS